MNVLIKSSHGTTSNGPMILQLPFELLDFIFDLALTEVGQTSPRTYTAQLAICMVCRKFNQIGQRFLYRLIDFWGSSPDLLANRLFHLLRTLKGKPELGEFCRNLYITLRNGYSEGGPTDLDLVKELIPRLPQIEIFNLYRNTNSNAPEWLSSASVFQNKSNLRAIRLSRVDCSYFRLCLQFPSLKELYIQECYDQSIFNTFTVPAVG
jgi:hypothetical protein